MTPDPAPITVHDRAADNLRFIRDTIERAGSFTAIPGRGGVLIGISAIITATLAYSPSRSNPRLWLVCWLADALLASIIAVVAIRKKAGAAGVSLTARPARRFFLSYAAPPFAAAVLTGAEAQHGVYWLMPATWLLTYGAAFIASGSLSIHLISRMGLCFIILGMAAAFAPLPVANIILGIGFGGLHLTFGWLIWRRFGG
jgi:hypothetical protein